jgi:hypothetical protein
MNDYHFIGTSPGISEYCCNENHSPILVEVITL